MSQVAFPKHFPQLDITEIQTNSEEREWKEPFTFILGADTQFGLMALMSSWTPEPEPSWHREVALTRQVIQAINKMKPLPRFFCICGDMLDAYPFAEEQNRTKRHGHLPRRQQQYQDFVNLFQELDPRVKLVCACGNHDLGDIPTQQTLQNYRDEFGPDYYSFWVGGVKFVVLNSQYMVAPNALPDETERHLEFLETIPDPTARHTVVFQHIPYFVTDPDEDTEGNSNIPLPQRHLILDKLQESGVRYIFCGHLHKNAGGFYKNIEQVVTGPIGQPLFIHPSGYRVCHVGVNNIKHEYMPLTESTKSTGNKCTKLHSKARKSCIVL